MGGRHVQPLHPRHLRGAIATPVHACFASCAGLAFRRSASARRRKQSSFLVAAKLDCFRSLSSGGASRRPGGSQ
jgi:hypothetical protein